MPPLKIFAIPEEICLRNQIAFAETVPLNVPVFTTIYQETFNKVASTDTVYVEPFDIETDDEWIQKSLNDLNADYQEGANEDHQMPRYELKGGKADRQFIKKIRTQIAKAAENYSDELLEEQKSAIRKLVNQPPQDPLEAELYRMQIRSGRKKELDIPDCIGLFFAE